MARRYTTSPATGRRSTPYGARRPTSPRSGVGSASTPAPCAPSVTWPRYTHGCQAIGRARSCSTRRSPPTSRRGGSRKPSEDTEILWYGHYDPTPAGSHLNVLLCERASPGACLGIALVVGSARCHRDCDPNGVQPHRTHGTARDPRDAFAEVRRPIRVGVGSAGRRLKRLITQRSQVQILPPLRKTKAP